MSALGPPAEQMLPGEAPTPEELNQYFVPFGEIHPVATKIPLATQADLDFFLKMNRISRMKHYAMMTGVGFLSASIGIFLGVMLFGGFWPNH